VDAVPQRTHQRSALYVCWDLRAAHNRVEDAQHQHPDVVVPYRIHDPSCAGAHGSLIGNWPLCNLVALHLEASTCGTAEALQRLIKDTAGRQGRTDCCAEDRLEHEHQRRYIHMEVWKVWVDLGLQHGSNSGLGTYAWNTAQQRYLCSAAAEGMEHRQLCTVISLPGC
jgi:hypothetical protein